MKEAVKIRLNAILDFIRTQLRETSTLRGIALLLGSLAMFAGYPVETVMLFVTFAAGILGIMLPDKLK